jgi:hypothetical protein
MDKAHLSVFKSICDEAPSRYEPYHISLLSGGVLVPTTDPPPYPADLRKVHQKRSTSAAAGNEKEATWVASHLCHNSSCIKLEHLRWEPSWFNRLRDNCPGGAACMHRPDPCLEAHRPAGEIIDWTAYLD